jgi:hypothetical protein
LSVLSVHVQLPLIMSPFRVPSTGFEPVLIYGIGYRDLGADSPRGHVGLSLMTGVRYQFCQVIL